jgi:iron-sulfur cluster repair protein YtfE (RIC family)
VALCPELASVLESFGLDTCCGGHFSVAEAAAHHNVELQPVMDAMRSTLARVDR